MAVPGRQQELQEYIKKSQKEVKTSQGAVFIEDPRKRRKCPLCCQNLYLYNINFTEMFLMCENSSCDFPFGYEALQIVCDESELVENPVNATENFYEYPTKGSNNLPETSDSILSVPTGTLSSMTEMSDTDKPSQISDDEDSYENDLAIFLGQTVDETISVKIEILSEVKEEKT